MTRLLTLLLIAIFAIPVKAQTADEIIQKIDDNMSADTRIVESSMIIHGRRNSRTITSVSYTMGTEKSFTEYLSPAREKGTKMLKLDDRLWTYYPANDRIVQISGHMLRQSLMGSDLSYEDMMDDRKLCDVYTPVIESTETIDGHKVFVLKLTAKVDDAAYYSRKLWVDETYFLPVKEELYAKSGQLLKRTVLSDFKQIKGRWYPMKFNFKDVLKQGDGTDWEISSIKFDEEIPDYLFTKAALKQ
ncbi:outer membrane lipoprotein-sorting protein [Carboxylicivirga mesophila]|uniref:Outer membrane lipoprotein-sorting protein n=1 Tax=Carboxylicivirga mesophila TaxID=1166478 RepID=A0ABS5K9N6_9BACT|nr:outer membrane lipoprotein-sorting protein [Carboxylicivirga mesophila]MBS2211734.1 outer membrane lipoprotein-sorting protein [Carboxylicivirga mesophila]